MLVALLLNGSATVATGSAATDVLDVEVHTTLPPVEGTGVQVVPGMLRLSPLAMLLQVMTVAAVWLDGLGLAVQLGAAGLAASFCTSRVPTAKLPDPRVCFAETVTAPSARALTSTLDTLHVPVALQLGAGVTTTEPTLTTTAKPLSLQVPLAA